MKHGKKYQDSVKSFEKQKLYDPREGLEVVLSTAKAKFDETVAVSYTHLTLPTNSRV